MPSGFGSCGAHMPAAFTFARSAASRGAATTKPRSSTSPSAGTSSFSTNRSTRSSNGRTDSGGSKSMSILRVQLGGQVMGLVEREQRDAIGVPVELLGAEHQLGDRRVADHQARAHHALLAHAER